MDLAELNNKKSKKSCGLSEVPKVNKFTVPCDGKIYTTKCVVHEGKIPGFAGFTQHEYNLHVNSFLHQMTEARTQALEYEFVVEEGVIVNSGYVLNIPTGVTEINTPFNVELMSVNIPDTVRYIHNGSFVNTNLPAVDLPQDTEYEENAFPPTTVVTGGVIVPNIVP